MFAPSCKMIMKIGEYCGTIIKNHEKITKLMKKGISKNTFYGFLFCHMFEQRNHFPDEHN